MQNQAAIATENTKIDYKAKYLEIRRSYEHKKEQIKYTKYLRNECARAVVVDHSDRNSYVLDATKATDKLAKITEELKECQQEMAAIQNKYDVANADYQNGLSNVEQLNNEVNKLRREVVSLKKENQFYKETIKKKKQHIANINHKLKTDQDLCRNAGKLDRATDKKSKLQLAAHNKI